MSRYGKNWGQPFGAFQTSEFKGVFYYQGFTSTIGQSAYSYSMVTSTFEHTSGISQFSYFQCSTTIPDKPILTGPLSTGPLAGDIYITWIEANPRDFDNGPVTYQIQYTNLFDDDRNWVDIITGIEQGNAAYVWNVRQIPRSKNIGIRMRAVDINGAASDWDTLPDTFVIENHAPIGPILLTPMAKESFDDLMLITWDSVDVKDFDGDKIFYKLEYSNNASSNRNWKLISNGVPFGVNQYKFDTTGIPGGNDYGIRISAIDEYGLQSGYSEVNNLTIFHHSLFIIDTTPPTGSFVINENDESTRSRDVHLTLKYNDAVTAVKDMRFVNIDQKETITPEDFGDYVPAAPYRYWRLNPDDGIKRVSVELRDYANNVTKPIDKKGIFRKFSGDAPVTALGNFVDRLWIAQQNGDIYDMQTITALQNELGYKINSMVEMGGKMYIGIENTNSTGTIYIADRFSMQVSINFSEIDSKVNTLEKFDLAYSSTQIKNFVIFAGLENGKIYAFQNDTWAFNYQAEYAVRKIYNSGNQIFALTNQLSEYLVYDPILATWDVREIVNV